MTVRETPAQMEEVTENMEEGGVSKQRPQRRLKGRILAKEQPKRKNCKAERSLTWNLHPSHRRDIAQLLLPLF